MSPEVTWKFRNIPQGVEKMLVNHRTHNTLTHTQTRANTHARITNDNKRDKPQISAAVSYDPEKVCKYNLTSPSLY